MESKNGAGEVTSANDLVSWRIVECRAIRRLGEGTVEPGRLENITLGRKSEDCDSKGGEAPKKE